MNKLILFKITGFVFAYLLFSILTVNSVFAVGQITTPIVISEALRGQEITAILSLVNSNDINGNFKLTATGDIEKWTSFFLEQDQKTPLAGEFLITANNKMNAVAVFKIPSDIPNGTYKGAINIQTVPIEATESNKNNVSISVGQTIDREVTITISDKENISASVSIIPENYTISEGKLFKVKTNIRNEGNIEIKPTIRLTIIAGETSKGEQIYDVIFPYPADKNSIKPGVTETLETVRWEPLSGNMGKFIAKIEVSTNNNIIKSAVIPFEIVPNNNFLLGNLSQNVLRNTYIVLFAIIFIAILVFLFIKKIKNNAIVGNQ